MSVNLTDQQYVNILRLYGYMFMVCHKLAPMNSSKTSTQGSYMYKWVNGFLWIVSGCARYITESSLVRLQRVRISYLRAKRASNGSCCCWKFLHQFAHPDADWPQYTGCFSACGTALQGYMKSSWKIKYSSLSLLAYKVCGYLLWENPAAFQ